MTGSKLCWEAIFRQGTICRLCPDAILRPDEIFSRDESGVTVKGQLGFLGALLGLLEAGTGLEMGLSGALSGFL